MKVELNDVDPEELQRFAQTLKDELPEVPMARFERALKRALIWGSGCSLLVNSDGMNTIWIRKP